MIITKVLVITHPHIINPLFLFLKAPFILIYLLIKIYLPYMGEATMWISEDDGIKYCHIAKYDQESPVNG